MIATNGLDVAKTRPRIIEVDAPAVLKDIFRLRVKAWRTNLTLPNDVREWHDELESASRHWVIFNGRRPIAAARLTIGADLTRVPDALVYQNVFPIDPAVPIGSLSRLVVDPEFRGRGFARELDRVRITAARASGCGSIVAATNNSNRARQLASVGFIMYSPHNSNDKSAGILAGTRPIAIGMLQLERPGNSRERTS
jgi:GNAT superfamily N-acetyltransferase